MFCYVESKNIFEYPKNINLLISTCFSDPLTNSIGQQLKELRPEAYQYYLKHHQSNHAKQYGYLIYRGEQNIIFINNRLNRLDSPNLYIVQDSINNFLNNHKEEFDRIAALAFHEYRPSIDFHHWMEELRFTLFDLEGPYFLISVPYSFLPTKPSLYAIDGVSFFKGNYPFSLDYKWSFTLEGKQYQTIRQYLGQFNIEDFSDEEIINQIRLCWRTRCESEHRGDLYKSCLTQIESSDWFICAEPDFIFGIGVNGFDSKRILYKPETWRGRDLLGRAYTLERKYLGIEVDEPSWIQRTNDHI